MDTSYYTLLSTAFAATFAIPFWVFIALLGGVVLFCASRVRRASLKERRWRHHGEWWLAGFLAVFLGSGF